MSNQLFEINFFVKALGILLLASVFTCFYLKTQNDFWIDDDPHLFARANSVVNPSNFFLDPIEIKRNNHLLTPMQMLSFWTDMRISGKPTPRNAYFHSQISYIVAAVLLFVCLSLFIPTNDSFLMTIAWGALPSVVYNGPCCLDNNSNKLS